MRETKLKRRGWMAATALFAGLTALTLLINSCSTTEDMASAIPQIEGATFVGDKACLDCHANITRAFPASPHARLHLDKSQMAGQFGCESCHGPASKHIAMAGSAGRDKFIVNPGVNPESCLQCHLDARAEFHLPQHHPVLEGKMNCVQCHDPHGLDILKPAGGLAMARLNESCAQCHRAQTKPVMYEHPAMREGCTSCHNPHGSINAKMLTARDSNVCLRCHNQVQAVPGSIFIGNKDHSNFLRFGTCWTAGCHVEVHGSNAHALLFY